MNGATHLAIGILCAYFAGADPLQIAAAGLGSLLPDIDNSGSISRPLGNFIPKIVPRLAVVQLIDGTVSTGSRVTRALVGHRGLTHWPLLAFAVGIASHAAYLPRLILWLSVGWLSHIYADAVTKDGVPLGAPLITDRVRLAPKWIAIRTGGLVETILSSFLWLYLLMVAAQYITMLLGG